jgi:hypothetical protein
VAKKKGKLRMIYKVTKPKEFRKGIIIRVGDSVDKIRTRGMQVDEVIIPDEKLDRFRRIMENLDDTLRKLS